jgi:hypothetical protein
VTYETTSSVSKHAHLYLGDAETDPTPVFRDLSPEGVRLPDGTLVAWPEGGVFAVYFDGARWPRLQEGGAEDLDCYDFFDAAGWPLAFPKTFRVDEPSFQREFQIFPYGWRTWRPATLERASARERSRPGRFATLRAQAGMAGVLSRHSGLAAPRT